MKLRVLSDLHNEFSLFVPPLRDDDKDCVCVLSGDIGVCEAPNTLYQFLFNCSQQFKHVVYIPGNHEYYYGDVATSWFHMKEGFEYIYGVIPNLHFLKRESVEIEGVLFVGATLWTDFNKVSMDVMLGAELIMNDYRKIRIAESLLQPEYVYKFHKADKRFVFDEIEAYAPVQKVVVVTHHAPTKQSIHPRFAPEDTTNFLYYSDLEEEICNLAAMPDLWIHGHTHASMGYTIHSEMLNEATRVICNPRGYQGQGVTLPENTSFDPYLVVEV